MRVARIAGIDLMVDNLFLVLLGVYTVLGFLPEALVLWGIVIIHESAHAVVAEGLGMKLVEIELMPFGGAARFADPLEADPRREIAVSIAGPISNFALAAAFWGLTREGLVDNGFGDFLIQSNLILGTFNMIPALPLDGGRIYRAYITAEYGLVEATRRAVRLSMGFAVALMLLGVPAALYGYLNSLSIGLGIFLLSSAAKERTSSAYTLIIYLSRKRQEIRSKGVLRARVLVALEDVPIGRVLREFAPRFYHLVIVVDANGKALGLVPEDTLIQKMLDEGVTVTVGSLLEGR